MGGGEVVACNMARVLKDEGYQVIFACGKIVSSEIIKDKLGIDISGIEFEEVQNEQGLKQLTINYQLSTVNLFINISFMDYSYGIGKKISIMFIFLHRFAQACLTMFSNFFKKPIFIFFYLIF